MFCLKASANLDALCATNTNPANFVLNVIIDSCIRSNGSSCELEKNCHPFERLWLSVRKRNVILSNDLGYPFEKNCHLFERLELSVQNNCLPPTSPEPFATNLSKNVRFMNKTLWESIFGRRCTRRV